MRKKLVR
nr:unnamed protein product [Callosobruchus chinensis]